MKTPLEQRALSLAEKNITKTEVTLVNGGIMVSRLIGSTLYYAIIGLELEMAQLKFYMELEDHLFIRFSVNLAKMNK